MNLSKIGTTLALICSMTGLAALQNAAQAATMDFDDLGALDPTSTYVQNGIAVEGNDFLNIDPEFLGGGVHMDDAGAPTPQWLVFTMASRFSAVSFDLFYARRFYQSCSFDGSDIDECQDTPLKDILVAGYRGTTLHALQMVDSIFDNGHVVLDGSFTGLTSLEIRFAPFPAGSFIPPDDGDPAGDYSFCVDVAPCSHFNIDNVTLAPVPLPAAGLLGAAALASLAWIGGRRRRMDGKA